MFWFVSRRDGEQLLSRCLEVILTGRVLLLLHCLNVLVYFTQRRGAVIGTVSRGDPHVRSDGFGETGGEEMPGAADASTQTVPWCSTTVSDLKQYSPSIFRCTICLRMVCEYYFLPVFRIILGTLAPFANVISKFRILISFCKKFIKSILVLWISSTWLFGGTVCLLPCD